jgi:hypothetical protein
VSNEPWRKLKVGDRIRIVRMPSDEPYMQKDTRRLFKALIARNRPSRVFWIDEYKHPWIRCRIKRKNGSWDLHWLAVNDDSWLRVRRRKKRS